MTTPIGQKQTNPLFRVNFLTSQASARATFSRTSITFFVLPGSITLDHQMKRAIFTVALIVIAVACGSVEAKDVYLQRLWESMAPTQAPTSDANLGEQDIRIEVPPGWSIVPSAIPHVVRLTGPKAEFEVTMVIQYHDTTDIGSIERVAKNFSGTQTKTFAKLTQVRGVGIKYAENRVFQDGVSWQVRGAAGLSDGQSLRSMTFFDARRSISIGAESSKVGQPELDSALMQVAARSGLNARTTSSYKSCHTSVQAAEFKAALANFRQKNFKSASDEFYKFIESHPNDPLVFQAYFWIGSSQYVERDYEAAISSLTNVTNASPHRYTAEAHLMIASIQFEMGSKILAHANLMRLIDRFPDSDAAAEARRRLGLQPSPVASEPSETYALQVTKAIRGNIYYNGSEVAVVEVAIKVGCDGKIEGMNITKPSSQPEWDVAVTDAVLRTAFIPLDANGVVPPNFVITFRTR